MPRYNLNHQDIQTIVEGLRHLALKANSIQEHTRINNLRNRLLYKLTSSLSDQDDDDLDPWEAFNQPTSKDDE